MLVRAVIFAAIFAGSGLAGGCKGDKNKCEQAARNYAELVYWKKANAELDKLPAAERELARKKRLSAYVNELEGSIDFFTQQCVSANNDDQVDCMIKAKTADEALKCADLATND